MTRRVLLSLFVALSAATQAPIAAAQQALPPEVVQSSALTAEQKTAIDQAIAAGIGHMAAAVEPPDYKRARDELQGPFKDPKASVSFRQYYGEKVAPELAKLVSGETPVKGDKDKVAINALMVAGDVASPETTVVLENALKDPRVAVQYAGASGLGRIFEAMTRSSPAIFPNRAQELVLRLGDVVGQENDKDVLDAAVRSLASATKMDRKEHDVVREAALETLGTQAGNRFKAMNAGPESDAAAPAMLRALTTIRVAVSGNLTFQSAGHKKAAELGGNAVTYVSRNIDALQQRPPEAREVQRLILNEAETLIQSATTKAGGTYTPTNLASDFAQGPAGARTFSTKYLQVMKALQGPPFNFPIGTFVAPQAPAGG